MKPFVLWDHLIVGAIVVLATLEWRLEYPRFKRALAAGVRHARVRMHLTEVMALWALTAALAALWLAERRPWSALLLGSSTPLRLAIGWGLALAYIALALGQRRSLLARPKRLMALAPSLGGAMPMIPTAPGERVSFAVLAVSAGICEELLFRGFANWYGTQWAGPIFGFVLSSLLFGYIHLYFDPKSVVRSGLAGVLFYVFAMAAGSLWPAMVAHAAIDLISGDLGYYMTRQQKGDAEASPSAA